MLGKKDLLELEKKAKWLRADAVNYHISHPESRIASALSCIEILICLFYCNFLKLDKKNKRSYNNIILSKGHGCFTVYFILKDLKLIPTKTKITSIPEPNNPFIKTINGSLGHGLGVGCGISLANRLKGENKLTYVILGDGELYEGAVWEAIMFAGYHKLGNLIAIIDNNKICMLDYCKNVIDLEPLEKKFESFNWATKRVDGHNINEIHESLTELLAEPQKPKVLIADTIKGMGVKKLMSTPLSHVMSLNKDDLKDINF